MAELVTITRDAEHRIVSQLAKGFNIDVVATRTHQPKDLVRRLAERHGYPDLGALGRAAQELAIAPGVQPAASGLLALARDVPELAAHVANIESALAELRQALEDYQQRDKLAAELAALEDEINQRQKRANQLRAKLTPNGTVVRAWAKAAGVECPATGRVPKDVVDAWIKAVASHA